MVVVMKKTGKFKNSIFLIFSILLYVVAGVVLAKFLIIPDGVNFFEYLLNISFKELVFSLSKIPFNLSSFISPL